MMLIAGTVPKDLPLTVGKVKASGNAMLVSGSQIPFQNISHLAPNVLVLHYCLPDMALMRKPIIAAKSNRIAGEFAQVTPATKIGQFIEQFSLVFKEYLCSWNGVCYTGEGESDD